MDQQSREDRPTPKPRWPAYRRPATDAVEREGHGRDGRPLAADRPAVRARSLLGRRRAAAWTVAGVAIAAGGVVYGTTVGEDAPDPYPREMRHQPILTGQGLDRLVAQLQARTGSTQVLDVWFEGDDEIRLSVPPAEAGDLADLWRWDGSVLEKWSAEKVGDRMTFDLEQVDPAVLVRLDEEARDRSDGDISASRAHVARPTTGERWIYLKVDEVDRGGVTLWADLQGDVQADLVNESWRDD